MSSRGPTKTSPPAPLLEVIRGPDDVKRLGRDQLQPLADEVRDRLIDVVSRTGGHIGAGLGVVELTVALAYCFDSPRDKIVWDVGHQGYPWKILTGRNDRLPTLRQSGGLSGFLASAVGWKAFYTIAMFAAVPAMLIMLAILRRFPPRETAQVSSNAGSAAKRT